MNDYRKRMYDHYQTTKGAGQACAQGIAINDYESSRKVYRCLYSHLLPKAKDSAILDLGCGYGRFLYYLQKEGYRNAEGVDISPEQITLAEQHGVEHVYLSDMSEFLRQRKDYYNCITVLDVIEHFRKEEILPMLDLIRSALVENGEVVITTLNASSLFNSFTRYGDFTHEFCFTPESIRQVLLAAGFRDIHVYPVKTPIITSRTLMRRIGWETIRPFLKAILILEAGSKGGKSRLILEHSFTATGQNDNLTFIDRSK